MGQERPHWRFSIWNVLACLYFLDVFQREQFVSLCLYTINVPEIEKKSELSDVMKPPSITCTGTSLVAQWLRICLPMQGTRVWSLVREDATCRRATKAVYHNYGACALEPTSHNYWAHTPRAQAPQQEKPLQWEACAPQWRVAPARCN